MADGAARKLVDDEEDTGATSVIEGIPLKAAREQLGDLVIRASVGNERIVITRMGKQTAALIGLRDLERLRALDGTA